jgi:hypothetical protein
MIKTWTNLGSFNVSRGGDSKVEGSKANVRNL